MENVGHWLDKRIKYLGYLGAAIALLSLLLVIFIISLNVFLRYFFGESLNFTFEYSEYLFIVMVYMGFAYTARTGAHITIDLVVRRLPERARDALDGLTSLVALGLMSIYLLFAWNIFISSIVMGKKAMTVLQTPEWIPHSVLVIGLAFLIPEIIAHIVKKSRDFQRGARKVNG